MSFHSTGFWLLVVNRSLVDGRFRGSYLALPAVKNAGFPAFWRPLPSSMQAPAAGDAANVVSVYVQISDFVTKVLIRKRFQPLPSTRELTNLET
jgi:hypothetical protein